MLSFRQIRVRKEALEYYKLVLRFLCVA